MDLMIVKMQSGYALLFLWPCRPNYSHLIGLKNICRRELDLIPTNVELNLQKSASNFMTAFGR